MDDLFSLSHDKNNDGTNQPLAERVRPKAFEDFAGQNEAFGSGTLLRKLLSADRLPSLILWGPPGSGKTTFANLVSLSTTAVFVSRSAIDTGAKELKSEGEQAKERLFHRQQKTVLFIDEIHRLNTAQQDCLLPYVEKGHLSLIGATTENPSFELNSALLSRCQVIIFHSHNESSLTKILDRALKSLDFELDWKDLSTIDIKKKIIHDAGGDARRGLNLLENIFSFYVSEGRLALTEAQLKDVIKYLPARYDKSREMHYDIISAFIKSVRGSDPHAALYYLARMLQGGEDPLFIARRLVILASEDVGNADPRALQVAVSVKEAVAFVGMPEAAICLSQAVTYLSTTPKSNASYTALGAAQKLAHEFPNEELPLAIRNAPTSFLKHLGYGEGYNYAHNSETGVTPQKFLPDRFASKKLYEPKAIGYEKNIRSYMDWVEKQTASPEKPNPSLEKHGDTQATGDKNENI